jgi:hypothetical protein
MLALRILAIKAGTAMREDRRGGKPVTDEAAETGAVTNIHLI